MNFETMTLRELMDAFERKKILQSRLENLNDRIMQKEKHCSELKAQLEKEKVDVLKLQTGGIHTFFKTVFRNKNEMIEKERLEVVAAGAKYEMAITDLAKMKEEYEQWSRERASLEGCESVFRVRYETQRKELEQSGNEIGTAILQIEEKISVNKGHLLEIDEAIRAADGAFSQADIIQDSLRSAEHWGFVDMIGGNLVANMSKRAYIDHAEQMIPELQRRLERLGNELDDVSVTLNHTDGQGDFLKFVDWFADGFFVDWVVQDKIHDFQTEIASVQNQIREIQIKLISMKKEAEGEIQQLEKELRECVLKE